MPSLLPEFSRGTLSSTPIEPDWPEEVVDLDNSKRAVEAVSSDCSAVQNSCSVVLTESGRDSTICFILSKRLVAVFIKERSE